MLGRLVGLVQALGCDRRGEDLAEYAIVASLIAIAAIVSGGGVGVELARLWDQIVVGMEGIP